MTYIKIKPGVVLDGIQPVTLRMWADVAEVYYSFGYPCVVTSGLDGKHKSKSLHYVGKALDFRTHIIPNGKEEELRDAVAKRLGTNFDVLFESEGKPWEHLHAEYDPD